MPKTKYAPNVRLASDAVAAIKSDPQSWNQRTWRCQTGMCMAGFVAMLAGGTFPYPADADDPAYWTDGHFDRDKYQTAISGGHLVPKPQVVRTPLGRLMRIADFASEALQISQADAVFLFMSENSLDRLEEMVEALAAGTPLRQVYREDD